MVCRTGDENENDVAQEKGWEQIRFLLRPTPFRMHLYIV